LSSRWGAKFYQLRRLSLPALWRDIAMPSIACDVPRAPWLFTPFGDARRPAFACSRMGGFKCRPIFSCMGVSFNPVSSAATCASTRAPRSSSKTRQCAPFSSRGFAKAEQERMGAKWGRRRDGDL
jgi:hypothetical protein